VPFPSVLNHIAILGFGRATYGLGARPAELIGILRLRKRFTSFRACSAQDDNSLFPGGVYLNHAAAQKSKAPLLAKSARNGAPIVSIIVSIRARQLKDWTTRSLR
jgi:hypothetical protein